MERDETTIERHNRILLEDEERDRQRVANDHGYGASGALADGMAAVLHAVKGRPVAAILLVGTLISIASLVLTGSLLLTAAFAVVAVGLAVSVRPRGGQGRGHPRQTTKDARNNDFG